MPLAATLALVGCAGQAPSPGFGGQPAALGSGFAPGQPASAAPGIGKTSGNIALLLPLSGQMAPIGTVLENAAKLAFPPGATPSLDVRDTGGTAEGAAAAAQAAIVAGDGIILGPLTSSEAHAVSPIAQNAGVNMLAFTNDSTIAAPGVWPLGITPMQQVQRVVQVAANAGRTQLAALLPDSDFGHSLGAALISETSTLGEPNPQITYYQSDFNSLNHAVEQMSDFADRGQSIEAQIKHERDLGTAAGRQKAHELQHVQIPPPSFNALFIGATNGNTLAELANFLPYYDVNPPQVQFLGPQMWSSLAPQMAHQPDLLGALYAAPDPALAAGFDAKYQTAYGVAPPAIADVAFDAAAIARLAAGSGGYTSSVLTAPAGFSGTDGVLVLQTTGQVARGLAVFQIAPGAPIITSPAPTQLNQPNS
ncbi:MAG TPA: penicillin-binding protein activator [Acidocella sp.]|nr:penicillin-binding protein activator [Acidocella sp.]